MNPVLPCCVNAGVGRMEVKIEPDCYDVTECLYDDKPGTGMFDILMLAEFSVIIPRNFYVVLPCFNVAVSHIQLE